MSTEISDRVDDHFDKVAAAEALLQQEQGNVTALRSQFAAARAAVVDPAMISLRDVLIARDLPAELVIDGAGVPGAPDQASAVLYIADNPAYAGQVVANAKYKIGFHWCGRVRFTALLIINDRVWFPRLNDECGLEELTAEHVESLLVTAIERTFPAPH